MHFTEAQKYISELKGMNLKRIEFIRGLGIIESKLVLHIASTENELDFEVESNFRIRTSSDHILSYNDLYIDSKRESISVRRFRSQKNIEKTYLHNQIIFVNSLLLSNNKITDVIIKEYGDVYFVLGNDVVIEVFADTHLENADLYRIVGNEGALEFSIRNNALVAEKDGVSQ